MKNALFVLGAADPEMEAIESLLIECGVQYTYARIGEDRVHPGNAYLADCPVEVTGGHGEQWEQVCRVECAWPDCSEESLCCLVETIDHHRPGDPGFGLPPSEFLRASSLGQVISHLAVAGCLPKSWLRLRGTPGAYPSGSFILRNWQYISERWLVGSGSWIVLPEQVVLIAAADHCLGAAYLGKCPGVDSEELMKFRANERAKFQSRIEPGVTVEVIISRITETQEALAQAPQIILNHGGPTGCGPDSGYDPLSPDYYSAVCVSDMRRDTPWPELPEAATRVGAGYISGPLIGPDGKKKFTCSGNPEQVRAFMENWAPVNGLTGIYGDPARGFAGGYDASHT